MKKLVLMCFVAIFFITGCNKKKDTQTLITNNYNTIFYPPYIPNMKPTIKQKIEINSLVNNKVDNITVESNSDGFIEKVLYDDESLNMIVNYHNKTMHHDGIDVTLQLDNNNNIMGTSYINDEQLASLSYNELSQLINIEDGGRLAKKKRTQLFKYSDGKTIIYVMVYNNFIYVTKFFYNQKGELTESITPNYINLDDETASIAKSNLMKNLIYNKKPENIKPNDVKCIFLNHNEYGDWTNAYCIKGNGVRISKYTRELEY